MHIPLSDQYPARLASTVYHHATHDTVSPAVVDPGGSMPVPGCGCFIADRDRAVDLGFTPVLPPKSNRAAPWEYDRELYQRRNEVECLFRRLKGFRRVFPRFDKLDVMFPGFVVFALVVDALRSVNTP